MNHFCSVSNQTYATVNVRNRRFISVEGNEIFGFFGKIVDDLLIKKHLRKCNLIGEPNLGERLDNGTWTGNLGLIQKGDAILYLKSEAPLIDTSIEKWMHYLFPYYREKFIIVQEISHDMENSYKEKSSDVINCFNFGLIFLVLFIFANLISFSIWILFKLFLSYQNFRKKRERRISIGCRIKKILINLLNGQWNLNYSKLTKISLFILFYSLHIWFIQLIIANNIKTDKVIVDHSILIKDENDALLTERLFCFAEGETELSIALNSNSHILSKLYNQKNIVHKTIEGSNLKIGERCILKKSFEGFSANVDIGTIFSITSENVILLSLSFIGNARIGDILWFNSKPIFEMDYHMIIKNQKDLIDSYNRITLLYMELGEYSFSKLIMFTNNWIIILLNKLLGIFKRFYDSFSLNSNVYLNSHIVYRTVEDFIKGNTKFTALNTDSFKLLFIIYISFYIIILIINLWHYLFIKINKNLFISFYTKL